MDQADLPAFQEVASVPLTSWADWAVRGVAAAILDPIDLRPLALNLRNLLSPTLGSMVSAPCPDADYYSIHHHFDSIHSTEKIGKGIEIEVDRPSPLGQTFWDHLWYLLFGRPVLAIWR